MKTTISELWLGLHRERNRKFGVGRVARQGMHQVVYSLSDENREIFCEYSGNKLGILVLFDCDLNAIEMLYHHCPTFCRPQISMLCLPEIC
jgi:hypothetical protein